MKIYTYYENLYTNKIPNYLKKSINLWKHSWERQGFEPILLGPKDAEKHHYYSKFNEKLKKIHLLLMGKEITQYGMSCWNRWLAYATQPNEKFFVSDYDVINVNFKKRIPEDTLHFMDGNCPCLASGNAKQFENLCYLFVFLTKKRLKNIKSIANQKVCYHDQNFFICNNQQLLQLRIKINRIPEWNINIHHISNFYIKNLKNKKIHRNAISRNILVKNGIKM